MHLELLHTVPIPNLLIHSAVVFFAIVLSVGAGITRVRARAHSDAGAWTSIFLGALLLLFAEYADLYTPAISGSIGLHQYFVHTMTFLAFIPLFMGFRALFASHKTDRSTSSSDAAATSS